MKKSIQRVLVGASLLIGIAADKIAADPRLFAKHFHVTNYPSSEQLSHPHAKHHAKHHVNLDAPLPAKRVAQKRKKRLIKITVIKGKINRKMLLGIRRGRKIYNVGIPPHRNKQRIGAKAQLRKLLFTHNPHSNSKPPVSRLNFEAGKNQLNMYNLPNKLNTNYENHKRANKDISACVLDLSTTNKEKPTKALESPLSTPCVPTAMPSTISAPAPKPQDGLPRYLPPILKKDDIDSRKEKKMLKRCLLTLRSIRW